MEVVIKIYKMRHKNWRNSHFEKSIKIFKDGIKKVELKEERTKYWGRKLLEKNAQKYCEGYALMFMSKE